MQDADTRDILRIHVRLVLQQQGNNVLCCRADSSVQHRTLGGADSTENKCSRGQEVNIPTEREREMSKGSERVSAVWPQTQTDDGYPLPDPIAL